ncbi:hypothetical protein MRX96_005508 [Rhipicephalus microplus]
MAANTSAVSLESLFLQLLGRLDSAGRCTSSSTTTSSCRRRSLRSEIRSLELWRAVIGECLATFFYVFLVCGAHVSWPGYAEPSVLAIALTSGAAAATLVQCYGHISGAHMNPAVTLATFATRKVSPIRTILYVSAQCGGAIAGAALLYGVSVPGHQSSLGSNRPHEALGAWQAFGVEFVLSFLLSSTVFATRDPHRSHLSAGSDAVVIGFAYLACTLAGLPATGASMNPARSLGPAFVMNKWVDHWVYWFGPISGGLLAGLIYEYIFETKKQARALRKTLEDADKETTFSVPPPMVRGELNRLSRPRGSNNEASVTASACEKSLNFQPSQQHRASTRSSQHRSSLHIGKRSSRPVDTVNALQLVP